MGIRQKSVKTQKKAIYKKLGITKDVELLWWLVCKRLGIEFDLKRIRRIGIEVLQDADV